MVLRFTRGMVQSPFCVVNKAAGGRKTSSLATNKPESLRFAERGPRAAVRGIRGLAQRFRRPGCRSIDLGVGDHARYLRVVAVRDNHGLSKLALGFRRLRRKDVAHLGLAALDFAGSSLRKALFRARMGLQLGHFGSLCNANRRRDSPGRLSQGFPFAGRRTEPVYPSSDHCAICLPTLGLRPTLEPWRSYRSIWRAGGGRIWAWRCWSVSKKAGRPFVAS